jgi:DNA-binding MarR family transcriptional regulator
MTIEEIQPVKSDAAPLEHALREQAAEVEDLLPRLMRRLFAFDPDAVTSQLPVAQLRICSILQDGARTMSALSDEVGVSMSALTQIAGRLERIGLVERVVHERDRRMRLLRLTPYGAETMRRRRETRVRSVATALDLLTPADRDELLTSLRALLEAARSPATDPPGGER